MTFRKILFLFFIFAVKSASAQTWGVSDGDGFRIANITNDAKYTTGVLCMRGAKCYAYIYTPVACEVKGNYSMLINSPVGVFPVTTTCIVVGETILHAIDQFDNALAAFRSGGEIGFAIPLKNGQFNVVRFSTAGAADAIDRAARAIQEPTTSAPPAKPKSVQTI